MTDIQSLCAALLILTAAGTGFVSFLLGGLHALQRRVTELENTRATWNALDNVVGVMAHRPTDLVNRWPAQEEPRRTPRPGTMGLDQ